MATSTSIKASEHAPSTRPRFRTLGGGPYLITITALITAALSGGLVAVGGPVVLLAGIGLAAAAWILIDYRIGILLTCATFPLRVTFLLSNSMFGIRGLSLATVILGVTLISVAFAASKTRLGGHLFGLTFPWPLIVLYLAPITVAAINGLRSIHLIPWSILATGAMPYETPLLYVFGAYISPLLVVPMGSLLGVPFRVDGDPRRYLIAPLLAVLTLGGLYAQVLVTSGHSFAFLASGAGRDALAATGTHPNSLASLFLGPLAVCLFLTRATAGGLRLVLIACAAVLTISILLTFSRTGFVCLLVVYLAFLINLRQVKAASIALALIAAALVALPEAFVQRATEGMRTMDLHVISAGRATDIWPQLEPLVADHPLLGGGLHSILWSAPVRTGHLTVTLVHNGYLEAILDMGLIGALPVIGFFVWAWRQMHLAGKHSSDPFYRQLFFGSEVMIPILFLEAMTNETFTPMGQHTFLWMAIGAAVGWRSRIASATANEHPDHAKAGSLDGEAHRKAV